MRKAGPLRPPRLRAGAGDRVNLRGSARVGSAKARPIRAVPIRCVNPYGWVPPQAHGQPGQGTNSDYKDIMSLAGLLTIVDDDPQLHGAVSRAEAEADSAAERGSPPGPAQDGLVAALAGEDLVAPPTLRPVLAAALTRPGARGVRGDGESLPGGSGGMGPPGKKSRGGLGGIVPPRQHPSCSRSRPRPGRPRTWPPGSAHFSRPTAWRTSPAGRPCPMSGYRRDWTPWGSGSPCSGGSPTRRPTASRTARWPWW